MTTNTHAARETWLQAAVQHLSQDFFDANDEKLEAPVQLSTAVITRKTTLGNCYSNECADDKKTRNIHIDSSLTDPIEVLHVLLHELCHAHLPHDVKHKAPFKQLAIDKFGLAGKPTATYAEEGTECHDKLAKIAEALGPYPHIKVVPVRKPGKPDPWMRMFSPNNPEFKVMGNIKTMQMAGRPLDPQGDEFKFIKTEDEVRDVANFYDVTIPDTWFD